MSQINVFFKRTVVVLLWLAGLYVFCRWLLLALLPFLVALGLSAITEPLVQKVRRKLRVRRSFAAAVVTTLLLLTIGGAAALLLIRLVLELQTWSNRLPEAVEQFPQMWNALLDRVDSWYTSCPVFLRSALDGMAQQLMTEGPSLAGTVSTWVMEGASALLAALPSAGLFLVTTVLAIYFTSLSYPAILSFLKRQLPEPWQKRCRSAAQCCRSTILKWLRAELLLILITFLLLLAGFTWMGLDFALLAAAFTALVEIDIRIGVGAVLIPWAVLSLLLGKYRARARSSGTVCRHLSHPLSGGAPAAGRAGGLTSHQRPFGDVCGIPLPGSRRNDPLSRLFAAGQAAPGCRCHPAVEIKKPRPETFPGRGFFTLYYILLSSFAWEGAAS